jgi:hypothetical protein
MSTQLQFEPFITSISITFWKVLAKKKLEELRLDDRSIPIWAMTRLGHVSRNSTIPSPPRLSLDHDSFTSQT